MTNFIAVLAENTYVYGYKPGLYHLKFNIPSLSRFMTPVMGIIDEFLLVPHHFLSNQSPFWWKIDYFVTVLAQNSYVCGCRPVLYYYKVNVRLLGRFMKPGMGIMNKFLLKLHNFLPSRSPFWREMDTFVAIMAQNTCVYGCRLILYHLKLTNSL